MGALFGALLSSPAARRISLAAVGLVAALCAYLYVTHLHGRIDAEKRTARHWEAQAGTLVATLARERENVLRVEALLAAERAREAEQAAGVETIIKEVYRERPPTPETCRAVLDPIADAFDGLRQLRSR